MVIAEGMASFLPTLCGIRRGMIRMEATVVGILLIAVTVTLYRSWPTNAAIMILGILAVALLSSLELLFFLKLWRMRHAFR